MGIFTAIVSALAIIIGTIVSTNAQDKANQQNIAATNNNMLEQERFAQESAEEANRDTERMYNNLYSPSAVINQQRNAGLSIGYLYGKGGGGSGGMSAAQAAQPTQQAPYINPTMSMTNLGELFGIPQQLAGAKKTEKESKKVEAETQFTLKKVEETENNINYIKSNIEKNISEIKLTEEKANTEITTQTLQKNQAELAKSQTDLNEWQRKFNENNEEQLSNEIKAKVDNLNELSKKYKEEAAKVAKEIDLLKIDEKYAEQLKELTIRLGNAQIALYAAQEAMNITQAILNTGNYILTTEQVKEVQEKVEKLKVETGLLAQDYDSNITFHDTNKASGLAGKVVGLATDLCTSIAELLNGSTVRGGIWKKNN